MDGTPRLPWNVLHLALFLLFLPMDVGVVVGLPVIFDWIGAFNSCF